MVVYTDKRVSVFFIEGNDTELLNFTYFKH